jgi:hypothetical protein
MSGSASTERRSADAPQESRRLSGMSSGAMRDTLTVAHCRLKVIVVIQSTAPHIESQPIPPTQQLSGSALRL